MRTREPWYVLRRGELLAEEFLWDLGAKHLSSLQNSEASLDFLAVFATEDGSSRILPVQVEPTEQEVAGDFAINAPLLDQLQRLNVPALLLVIDVKRNEIHFAWVEEAHLGEGSQGQDERTTLTVPLRKATLAEKQALKREIAALGSSPERKETLASAA